MSERKRVSSFAPRVKLGAGLIIGSASLSILAQGQTILPESVVSAERLPQRSVSTQSSVSVTLDTDQSLVDDLNRVPGVTVVQSGPDGANASIFARGTNSGHTLFLLDGIPINDPGGPGGAMNVGGLTATGLGSLEVIRGPGTLYGSQAIGATVALQTAAPERDGITLAASGGYPLQGTVTGSAALVGDTYAMQTTLSERHKEDFYIDARRLPGASRDNDYGEMTWASYLAWSPDDDNDLMLTARWTSQDGAFSPAVGDPNGAFESDHRFMSLRLEHQVADGWETTLRVGFSDYDRKFTDAPDAMSSNFQDLRIASTRLYAGAEQSAQWDAFDLKVGLEAVRDSVTNDGSYGSTFGVSTTDVSASETNYAGWFSITHHRGPVTLSGGARADYVEDFGFHVAARAGAALALDTGTVLHANYGTAFKAPSLEDRYATYAFGGTVTFTGNPDLRPETSRTFEIGVSQEFETVPATISLTAFHTELDDLIAFSTNTTVNVDEATIDGIEIAAEAEVVAGLTLSGDFAWTLARDGDGNRLLRRPRTTFGAGIEWQPLDTLTFNADVNWTGSYADVSRTTFSRIENGRYTKLDASVAYEVNDDVTLELVGTNLLDADYEPADGYQAAGFEVHAGVRIRF